MKTPATFLVLLLCIPTLAAGQKGTQTKTQTLVLASPSPSPDSAIVYVSVDPPRPEFSTIESAHHWVVVARDSLHPAGVQVQIKAVRSSEFYSVSGLVHLELTRRLDPSVFEVDVLCLLGKGSRVTWKSRKRAGGLGFNPVKGREKADVYLSGSWVTGVQTGPAYNADITAGAPVFDSLGPVPARLVVTASLKASDRPRFDSDAYSLAARASPVFPIRLGGAGPPVDVQWDLGRLEFTRKNAVSNVVSSPGATVSFGVLRTLRKDRTVLASVDLDLSAALEIGRNNRNTLFPEGYGAIRRLVPGFGLYASFPGALGLQEVRWATTYRARMLGTKEPVVDRRDERERVSVDRGTRPEWSDELTLKLNPIVGFAIRHEYGGSPPAFKLLDHRISCSATVMWTWKKV